VRLGPRAGKAQVSTRIRLADTQKVIAIAEMSDDLLVRHPGGDRHARGLPGGPDDMSARALINVPKTAKRGEVIEIRTLISHVMETGFRHGTNGRSIPRDIITSLTVRYNGEEIFSTLLYPAIAANPFVTFSTVATESGTLTFTWEGDNGSR
jgi:sulfur-oxidizing protein SoxZ